MLKKYVLLLVTFLTIFAAVAPISVNAETQNEKRVYDRASLFTEEQTEELEERIASITSSKKMDVVIVTTNSTGKKTDREYADDFYDDPQYNFGFGKYKAGVLLLINLADAGSVYISTCGEGLYYMTDGRIERTLDYLWPAFESYDNFNTAYKFLDKAEEYSHDTVDDYYDPEFPDGYDGERTSYIKRLFKFDPFFAFLTLIISSVIVILFIVSIKIRYGKVKDSLSVSDYLSADALQVTPVEDTFVSTKTVRVNVSSSKSGGSHSSSSGRSHGGGGRSR